jgi:hypothetical protein
MFTAWLELFRTRFGSKREFVSLDAKQYSENPHFELTKVHVGSVQSPQSAVTSPGTDYDPYGRDNTGTPDYFGKEIQREYRSPDQSFSTPRAPSQAVMRVEWDPRATHARGGLGFHPPAIPDEEDEDERGMRNKI